jgi:hypothetical protein
VRIKKQLYKQDNEIKKTILRQDVLIIRIQRLYRGYKNRKINRDRIKLQENGIDWIEVRDVFILYIFTNVYICMYIYINIHM